jgi:hypothetical protein
MAAKSVKLTSPNGGTVSVAEAKVEGLLRRGFTEANSSTKTTTKKSTSSKSSK